MSIAAESLALSEEKPRVSTHKLGLPADSELPVAVTRSTSINACCTSVAALSRQRPGRPFAARSGHR